MYSPLPVPCACEVSARVWLDRVLDRAGDPGGLESLADWHAVANLHPFHHANGDEAFRRWLDLLLPELNHLLAALSELLPDAIMRAIAMELSTMGFRPTGLAVR